MFKFEKMSVEAPLALGCTGFLAGCVAYHSPKQKRENRASRFPAGSEAEAALYEQIVAEKGYAVKHRRRQGKKIDTKKPEFV